MITIGIPTAGRINKLSQCIESIDINTRTDYKFIIIDNSINGISNLERLSDSDVQLVKPPTPLSPSASRELIGNIAKTELILYIDEDMTVSIGSVDYLFDFLVVLYVLSILMTNGF